jgi:hypothetical protein
MLALVLLRKRLPLQPKAAAAAWPFCSAKKLPPNAKAVAAVAP